MSPSTPCASHSSSLLCALLLSTDHGSKSVILGLPSCAARGSLELFVEHQIQLASRSSDEQPRVVKPRREQPRPAHRCFSPLHAILLLLDLILYLFSLLDRNPTMDLQARRHGRELLSDLAVVDPLSGRP
ncbi:hypothetical protein ZWY2020_048122 [Hordeum vulgare]|nr:hypothetical protein ZWY2020_048122 [Hordeum vulgare]